MHRSARWTSAIALSLILFACTPGTPPPTTTLHVDPVAGDDGNPGTSAAPLRTLTRALDLASSGFTIRLGHGIYDEANGEVWRQQSGFPPASSANVPDGVTLIGDGARLSGPGSGSTAAALVFAGSAEVRDLEIRGFERAILASEPATVHLLRLTVFDNGVDGLLAYGNADVQIEDSVFYQNTLSGVAAFGSARLSVEGGRIHDNRTGVYVAEQAEALLVGVEIDANGSGYIDAHSAIYAIGEAKVTLDDVSLHDNAYAGVEAYHDVWITMSGSASFQNSIGIAFGTSSPTPHQPVIQLSNSDIHHNSLIGIGWWGGEGGVLRLRGTAVTANTTHGVFIVGEPDVIDLGSEASPGGNDLSSNIEFQLFDARPARAAPDGPIITVQFGDLVPATPGCAPMPVGVIVGAAVGICDGVSVLYISNSNNRVQLIAD